MKKCINCQIGTYSHSGSEDAPLMEDLEVDGLGHCLRPIVFNFCPLCGHRINKLKFFKCMKVDEMEIWVWKDYIRPKFRSFK